MPDVRLRGCGARPLVGYLKALGILRAVSRQVDRSARGRWAVTAFELRSELTEDDLREFFLGRFAPSPILSPWNGRSGFYTRGGRTAEEALASIESSGDERFAPYRALIASTREILSELGIVEKPADRDKERLVRELRRRWSDVGIEWLDAAIVIAGDGPSYPPLLGSGGNEGSYDFSSNYMQSVTRALAGDRGAELLDAALFGSSAPLEDLVLGHLQGDASPTNSPKGDAGSLGNSWDLVLGLEGSLSLVGGAARRHEDGARGMLTAPFTVRPTAAGYGAAVAGEKGRAELWLPIWRRWAAASEIANLIRESRAQVRSGRGTRTARSGLDFARAAGELGVARGIDAFERYTILERYGQTNIAVPAGRIQVAPRPAAAALQSIDWWLSGLLRFADNDHCPNAVAIEARRLERACFAMAARGRPADTLAVLERMGAAEAALARSGSAVAAGLRPLGGAPASDWIKAADDGSARADSRSAELALAVSIGSLRPAGRELPAVRDYLNGTRRTGSGAREFDPDRRHLLSARSSAGLLASIHARSHLDAEKEPDGSADDEHRLGFRWGVWCDVRVARLLAVGAVDVARVLRLTRGTALLDDWDARSAPKHRPTWPPAPVPSYDALALAWWGKANDDGSEAAATLGPRRGWAARLAAGSVEPVLRDALLRLRLARIPPVAELDDLVPGAPAGERLAAALLVSLSRRDLARLKRIVSIRAEDETNIEREAVG